MGQLINKCTCKYSRKFVKKEEDEESDSDDSFSENEGDVVLRGRRK